jgi:phytoene dehydrogenase-like protein
MDHPAVVVTGTRCVCLATTPTLVAPELAPDGWHVTETISTFRDSTDDREPAVERERHFADMDDLFPDWRRDGRLLQVSTYRGTWPVYRSWPGRDAQERHPLPGLALVGDSVKPPGFPGVGASAESARLVVEAVLAGAPA